jgi:hypothetical protein
LTSSTSTSTTVVDDMPAEVVAVTSTCTLGVSSWSSMADERTCRVVTCRLDISATAARWNLSDAYSSAFAMNSSAASPIARSQIWVSPT